MGSKSLTSFLNFERTPTLQPQNNQNLVESLERKGEAQMVETYIQLQSLHFKVCLRLAYFVEIENFLVKLL